MPLPQLQWQGPIKDMGSAPSLAELQKLLESSMETVQAFKAANPRISNLQKLSNRIKRDLQFVTRQHEQLEAQTGQQASEEQAGLEQWGGLEESRLQGIVNNLRGFHGELMALHEAPGVIAVCKKFTTELPKVWTPSCNITQKPQANGNGISSSSSPVAATATAASTAAAAAAAAEPGPSLASATAATAAAGDRRGPSAGSNGLQCWWDADASADAAADSGYSSDSSAYGSSPASAASRGGGMVSSRLTGSHRNTQGQQQQQQQPGSSKDVPCRRTYTLQDVEPQQGQGGSQAGSSEGAAAAPAASEALLVEVDVVAHEGLTWIEVKNQELFGLDSVHWLGSSHTKGLAQQVQALQAVAAAPVNRRRWRCPEVVVYFPSGVSSEVAAALRDMGVVVADGPGSLAALPAPASPNITNLDVTSLCALVSEVSWGDPHSPELQAWAARTSHWQDCLAAQIQQPLLPQLQACLGDSQQLVTSCLAVEQFQTLMDMFGGPREQQRWQELLQRMSIYHHAAEDGQQQDGTPPVCGFCGSSNGSSSGTGSNTAAGLAVVAAVRCGAGAGGDGGSGGCQGEHQQWPLLYREPQRIRQLDKLGRQQRAVFGLGDALQAVTLTANGNAVRCCEQYGVKLEVVLHWPVWLTGM